MIMTNSTILDAYRTLTEEYGEDPKVAIEGLGIVSNFCATQRCEGCTEGGDFCTGCKSREKNSDGYYSHINDEDEIVETIEAVGKSMKKANKISQDLAKDIQNLEKKIDDKMDGFEVDENFFKTVDQINFQMQKIKENGAGFDSAVADRINQLEEKIRHPVHQSDNLDFDPSEKKIFSLPKKKSVKTTYEKGHCFARSEAAQQAIG